MNLYIISDDVGAILAVLTYASLHCAQNLAREYQRVLAVDTYLHTGCFADGSALPTVGGSISMTGAKKLNALKVG